MNCLDEQKLAEAEDYVGLASPRQAFETFAISQGNAFCRKLFPSLPRNAQKFARPNIKC